MTPVHNAHLLIPKALWQKAKAIARTRQCSVTEVVIDALTRYFAARKDSKPKTP